MEMNTIKENYKEVVTNLNNDKEHLNEQITVLINEKDYLLNENKKLIQKFDESKTNSFNNPKSEIIKGRAEKLLESYSNFSEEEQVSFIEILKYFNKTKTLSIWKSNINEITTFPLEAKRIIQILLDNDILNNYYSMNNSSPDLKLNKYGSEIIKYLLENHFN